jgi:hypothetical protein
MTVAKGPARFDPGVARAEAAIRNWELVIMRLTAQGAPDEMLKRAEAALQRLESRLAEELARLEPIVDVRLQA